MAQHAPARYRLVILGVFVLVSVMLTILAYRSVGGSPPLASNGYRLELPLPNARTLVAGSEVQIAGVKIGRIVEIRRAGNSALVTADIKPRFAPIHTRAVALVRTKTLLGEAYIELAPGPRTAPQVPDGGRLPASQVRAGVSLDEFLETFRPSTRRRVRDAFAGLSAALRGRGEDVNNAFGYAAPVTEDLASVATVLDRQTGQLQDLFASSRTVLDTLGSRSGDLHGAITAADQVLSATASRNRQLAATVRALPGFLDQVRAVSKTISADSGDLNRAAESLEPVAPLVVPVLSTINRDVPQFRALFDELPKTIAAGKRGLPPLTAILNAIPGAFKELYPTARELIPVLQLLAEYREASVIGPLANGGSIFNGTLVGAGGKIIHRTSGALYLSNETPVGWVKRLPTHRSNPYPTPNAFDDLVSSGYLKSYDCRHLNNPLYLPPIGTGVPPCVTQGKWTYGGVSAYYPRLQRAPR